MHPGLTRVDQVILTDADTWLVVVYWLAVNVAREPFGIPINSQGESIVYQTV